MFSIVGVDTCMLNVRKQNTTERQSDVEEW